MHNFARPRAAACRRRGFTLIEVLVVVIILGILAATIIPQFQGMTQDAKVARARTDIGTLESSLERYYLNLDRYPTSEEGLMALVQPPSEAANKWRGPYIKALLRDPWGHPYNYRSPGRSGPARTYDIWSQGADGAEGGEGENADVGNWQEDEGK